MQKECHRCKKIYETASEHSKYCKSCNKAYRIASGVQKPEGWTRKTEDLKEYLREWRKANPDKCRAYEKSKPKSTPEQNRRKYVNKMKRIHGEDWQPAQPRTITKEERTIRQKARELFKTAVRYGRITRQPCEVCGEPKTDGHHTDYDKPLEVVWLCRKHHAEVHHSKT